MAHHLSETMKLNIIERLKSTLEPPFCNWEIEFTDTPESEESTVMVFVDAMFGVEVWAYVVAYGDQTLKVHCTPMSAVQGSIGGAGDADGESSELSD